MSKIEKGKKAVKSISIMAVLITLAKFLGLLREMLIAGIYGQGYASDVINSATQIPLLFFDMVLGVAILSTFVPDIQQKFRKTRKRSRDAFRE